MKSHERESRELQGLINSKYPCINKSQDWIFCSTTWSMRPLSFIRLIDPLSTIGRYKKALLPLLAILLVSCATKGSGVNDSDTATLQNQSKELEKYDLSLKFVEANGKPLSPGYWTAPTRAKYKILPGNVSLIVDITFYEHFNLKKGRACLHRLIPLSATIEKEKTYVVEATVNGNRLTAWISEHGTEEIVSPVASKEMVRCSHFDASLLFITK